MAQEEREPTANQSLPAARDPKRRQPDGRFVPGHGIGRPKGRRSFRTVLEGLPAADHRVAVAKYFGCAVSQVPHFDTLEEYLVWMEAQDALRGNREARNNILDRLSPKPSRVQVEADVTHRPGPPVGGRAESAEAREAAQDYMDRLEGDLE